MTRIRKAALAGVFSALGACSPVSGLETRARILAQPTCSNFFFPIYFARQSADVPQSARGLIASSAHRSRGCRVQSVEVVGLPAPDAEVDPKLQLSRQRARHVAEALQAAGFPAPRFQLSPLGDAGEGLPSALVPRRRADVYVRFSQ